MLKQICDFARKKQLLGYSGKQLYLNVKGILQENNHDEGRLVSFWCTTYEFIRNELYRKHFENFMKHT